MVGGMKQLAVVVPLAPHLFHTRVVLEVDGSLVVLSLLVFIAKIQIRGDP